MLILNHSKVNIKHTRGMSECQIAITQNRKVVKTHPLVWVNAQSITNQLTSFESNGSLYKNVCIHCRVCIMYKCLIMLGPKIKLGNNIRSGCYQYF